MVQSSHISSTDHLYACYPSMVRLRRLELAGIGLVQASGSGSCWPGSYGDKSWERTTTVKDNKVHHRSISKTLLLTTPTHIGTRNKNGLYVVYSYPFLTVIDPLYHIANKPRGLQAARKLRNSRRDNRWVRFSLGLPCLHYPLIPCTTVGALLFMILGGQIIQKARPWKLLQNITHRRIFTRQGYRSREGWRRGEAAQLCHSQVCACTAHQEREEGHCFRSRMSFLFVLFVNP